MIRLPHLLRGFALLLCLCGGALSANASHIWGAELTYEYAGTSASPHQYHVVARLIRDLNSVVTEPFVTLTCGRNECSNVLPGSFVTTLTRTGSTPIPAGCTGNGLRYELTVLEGLVVLPPAHWTLGINLSNRQVGVVNILQSQMQSTYVKAELDNTSSLINSSPRFTTTRVIQLVGTQPQRYSASAFDSEGDSLAYQLVSRPRRLQRRRAVTRPADPSHRTFSWTWLRESCSRWPALSSKAYTPWPYASANTAG